jgi:glucan phosphoethanolaminetransferase (alkaline phosphatase superfamily)
MIQRIQSLYLFLTTLLSLLFLNGGFLSFINKTGYEIKVTFTGVLKSTGGQGFEMIEKLLPLSLLIILIPLISLITIFIFKNRKIQLRFSIFLIILSSLFVIALIHVSFSIISKFDATIIPGFKMILPILILIFSILSYRGIRKDDRLVKSYDRLR